MKEMWLLTNSVGKPIGLFTEKEIGLQAVGLRGLEITGVEDCDTEVIIGINDKADPTWTLQKWAVNKALVDGEWKVLNTGR